MAKNVIIHLPKIGEDYLYWAVADDKGSLVSDIESGTFEEAVKKVEGRRSTLVVPGDDVLLAEAKVPGGSARAALLAVPNVLEEQLADDVESLHFAIGEKGNNDMFPVAIIGRDSMKLVQIQCEGAGLRPSEVVPETLALPKPDEELADSVEWTALVDNNQTIVRMNGYKGFATDADMANIMLDGARSDLPEDTDASIIVYRTSEYADVPELQGVEVETRKCDSRLDLYASGLASSPHINLLQGEYSPKTQFDNNWKPWRWTAALLGVLFVTLVAGKWIDYQRSGAAVSAVDARVAEVFKKALPGTRMVRPVNQIETRVKQLSGGSSDGFTNRLSQISASLATQPQTQVRSISYREGRFDLDLTTDAIPTLDLLKSELGKRGQLSMTVQSANREKGGLRGRVRIE